MRQALPEQLVILVLLVLLVQSDLLVLLAPQDLQGRQVQLEQPVKSVPPDRRAQLDRLAQISDQLYPRLRLYVFDARRVFSAPVTVFGPLLAVIYLGRHYVAFRDSQRVGAITQHFDWLVREAEIGARDFPSFLRTLRDEVRESPASAGPDRSR